MQSNGRGRFLHGFLHNYCFNFSVHVYIHYNVGSEHLILTVIALVPALVVIFGVWLYHSMCSDLIVHLNIVLLISLLEV